MEKSFVAVTKCFVCGDSANILLDTKLRDTLEQNMTHPTERCHTCTEALKIGIALIECRDGETDRKNPYRTGRLWVLKEDAFKGIFNGPPADEALKSRICFIDQQTAAAVGLDKEPEKKWEGNNEH